MALISFRRVSAACLIALSILAPVYVVMVGKASILHETLLNSPDGSISALDVEAACILQPYQDRLHTDGDLAVNVNDYLSKTGFVADEGHFAFVLLQEGEIRLERIARSRTLDLLAKHEISSEIARLLPDGFAPQDCVQGHSAAITKIEFRNRPYIVFGKAR